jgi:hypothetical protein
MKRTDVLPGVALAALVGLLKIPWLDTPAYWDEMGWMSPSQWLLGEGLRGVLPGRHPAWLFWGHPPGLHLALAVLWRFTGPSLASAHLLIVGFAALGVCGTFWLARYLYDEASAWFAALFLLVTPLYFAQAGMFLADLPVAALAAWSIYLGLRERYLAYLVCATCMVGIKETAVPVLVALILYRLLAGWPLTRASLSTALRYSVPLWCYLAFIVVQKLTTGKFLWIYNWDIELFRLAPAVVGRQVWGITRWVFLVQGRWLFSVLILLALVFRPGVRRRELWLFLLILTLVGYEFSILAFTPRYLLPVLPFFFVLGAASLMQLVRGPGLRVAAGLLMLGVMTWSLLTQPFQGASTVNLRYREVVRLHRQAGEFVAARDPDADIVANWPVWHELLVPLYGYVPRPLKSQSYEKPGDIAGADLIVVSRPSAPGGEELWQLAREGGWRSLLRLGGGPNEIEAFERPR